MAMTDNMEKIVCVRMNEKKLNPKNGKLRVIKSLDLDVDAHVEAVEAVKRLVDFLPPGFP